MDTAALAKDRHRHLLSLHDKYGDSFVYPYNGTDVLFARGPSAIRMVLNSRDFGKVWQADSGNTALNAQTETEHAVYVHNLVQPLLPDPIFGKKGSHKSDRRTLLQPFFSNPAMFAKGFEASFEAMLSKWNADKEVDALKISHDLLRVGLYYALAGDACGSLDKLTTAAFENALQYFVGRYQDPDHNPDPTSEDQMMMSKLREASEQFVAEFRKAQRVSSSEEKGCSEEKAPFMLGLMLDAGCTDAEMAAILVNVVIAGAEAPASALAHTLQELAAQPLLQQRLRDEMRTAGCSSPSASAAELLDSLPFGKACVLEGLRLFAPATLVKRQALSDVVVDGFAVPSGTVVEICVTAAHNDEKQFANPSVYDPDRVGLASAGIIAGKDRCFMPFSGGRRGCPGRAVALTMMRIALAGVLQRFELLPVAGKRRAVDETVRVSKFVEWPSAGIPIKLKRI